MIRILTALAVASSPALDRAEPGGCLQREEAIAVFQVMLPAFIEGAASRCSAILPPQAFLRTGATGFAERLRRETKLEPGVLTSALSKAAGQNMPPGISDATVLMLTNDITKGMLTQELRDESCSGVNEMIEAVAPLPAKNITMLLSGLMTVMPNSATHTGFSICRSNPNG